MMMVRACLPACLHTYPGRGDFVPNPLENGKINTKIADVFVCPRVTQSAIKAITDSRSVSQKVRQLDKYKPRHDISVMLWQVFRHPSVYSSIPPFTPSYPITAQKPCSCASLRHSSPWSAKDRSESALQGG